MTIASVGARDIQHSQSTQGLSRQLRSQGDQGQSAPPVSRIRSAAFALVIDVVSASKPQAVAGDNGISDEMRDLIVTGQEQCQREIGQGFAHVKMTNRLGRCWRLA